MTAEQLVLFAVENGNGGRTVRELGLRREIGPAAGAERLLRELVRRGLAEQDHLTAAALALELDRGTQA